MDGLSRTPLPVVVSTVEPFSSPSPQDYDKYATPTAWKISNRYADEKDGNAEVNDGNDIDSSSNSASPSKGNNSTSSPSEDIPIKVKSTRRNGLLFFAEAADGSACPSTHDQSVTNVEPVIGNNLDTDEHDIEDGDVTLRPYNITVDIDDSYSFNDSGESKADRPKEQEDVNENVDIIFPKTIRLSQVKITMSTPSPSDQITLPRTIKSIQNRPRRVRRKPVPKLDEFSSEASEEDIGGYPVEPLVRLGSPIRLDDDCYTSDDLTHVYPAFTSSDNCRAVQLTPKRLAFSRSAQSHRKDFGNSVWLTARSVLRLPSLPNLRPQPGCVTPTVTISPIAPTSLGEEVAPLSMMGHLGNAPKLIHEAISPQSILQSPFRLEPPALGLVGSWQSGLFDSSTETLPKVDSGGSERSSFYEDRRPSISTPNLLYRESTSENCPSGYLEGKQRIRPTDHLSFSRFDSKQYRHKTNPAIESIRRPSRSLSPAPNKFSSPKRFLVDKLKVIPSAIRRKCSTINNVLGSPAQQLKNSVQSGRIGGLWKSSGDSSLGTDPKTRSIRYESTNWTVPDVFTSSADAEDPSTPSKKNYGKGWPWYWMERGGKGGDSGDSGITEVNNSYSSFHSNLTEEALELEIAATKELVELIAQEHTMEYLRLKGTIQHLRQEVRGLMGAEEADSSDCEMSVIDTYLRDSHVPEINTASDYGTPSLEEDLSPTLQVEDISDWRTHSEGCS